MTVRRKRLTTWLVITGTTAVLAVGGWWAYQVSAAMVGTLGVPCDEAARFVRAAELPAGTRDRRCTTGQWLSISYELDFRAPREETEAWLRASYPDMEISWGCSGADACGRAQLRGRTPFNDKNGQRLADGVNIELDHEDGDVTHVRISGFTV
ncbi:hypothetical protein BCL76_11278 [Streptomyces sp. CG 926]|uniref:hypothetical protein n=1 Tax=Streptomyces sp. CG 926 TaxID=1882405 RepID=UPI000D6B494F|nr:hypothetical protein [Streptomyces sp. CG 926]PWK65472.1 hypothetical protein BCL76_11278 [Streptomyces sp. CG 926]